MQSNEFVIADLALNPHPNRRFSEADFYETHGRRPVVTPALRRVAAALRSGLAMARRTARTDHPPVTLPAE